MYRCMYACIYVRMYVSVAKDAAKDITAAVEKADPAAAEVTYILGHTTCILLVIYVHHCNLLACIDQYRYS